MALGFQGYDAARIAVLSRRLIEASDELIEFAGSAPARFRRRCRYARHRRSAALGVDPGSPAHRRRHDADLVGAQWRCRSHWCPAVPPTARLATPTTASPAGGQAWHRDRTAYRDRLSTLRQIGNLDGVPGVGTRPAPTGRLLGADLASLAAEEAAGTLTDVESAVLASATATVEQALAEGAEFVDPRSGTSVTVQLYLYEPAATAATGASPSSLGDLDTARHIAVVVPGMGTEASAHRQRGDRGHATPPRAPTRRTVDRRDDLARVRRTEHRRHRRQRSTSRSTTSPTGSPRRAISPRS